MVTFREVAPVFSVRDVAAALDHYRRLGFTVSPYDEGREYGFAERGGVKLHLGRVPDLDPAANGSCAYLYVDDADALAAEWQQADVGGRFHTPIDTDYGLREGAHVDPDGNLLRYGSPKPG